MLMRTQMIMEEMGNLLRGKLHTTSLKMFRIATGCEAHSLLMIGRGRTLHLLDYLAGLPQSKLMPTKLPFCKHAQECKETELPVGVDAEPWAGSFYSRQWEELG